MKSFRVFLMVAVVIGMGSIVSCSKETPAEEIDGTTQKMEGKAVELQKKADQKAQEIMDRNKK